MKEHIILIGFMGAGKTTVGKALARQLGVRLLDTDQLIEEQAGTTVSHIFESQGEEAFRRAETQLLKSLSAMEEKAVISVGGGLPLREENRKFLKEMGIVVFLQVQADTVLKRLKGDTTRPLLQGKEAKKRVADLLTYRIPFYQEAACITIDVDNKKAGMIAKEIVRQIQEEIKDEAIGIKRSES